MARLGASDAIEKVRAIQAARGLAPVARRSFFAHEAGTRGLKAEDVDAYAEAYGVAREFLAGGAEAAAFFDESDPARRADAELALIVVRRAIERRARNADDEEEEEAGGINQQNKIFETESSQNLSTGHIAILSTGTLKQLKSWTGDLTNMSDETTPVPDALPSTRARFAFTIPADDHSMVSRDGVSFYPGTLLHVLADAPIPPDSCVLAHIDGFDALLFRIYEAARPYAPGASFTLRALNPAYKPVEIPRDGQCLKIALVLGGYVRLLRR